MVSSHQQQYPGGGGEQSFLPTTENEGKMMADSSHRGDAREGLEAATGMSDAAQRTNDVSRDWRCRLLTGFELDSNFKLSQIALNLTQSIEGLPKLKKVTNEILLSTSWHEEQLCL
jgi:hypothetical protein